jgi:hypothetical protein
VAKYKHIYNAFAQIIGFVPAWKKNFSTVTPSVLIIFDEIVFVGKLYL